METRKLQRVGGGTYTVSIPKEWATTHGLEAGTTVNLYTHTDGSIVIRSYQKDGGNLDSARIELDQREPAAVKRALRAAQTAGFETVTLVSAEPFTDENRRAVRSLVRSLVGTEIVAEGDHELTIQNLLDAADVSVRQSVVQAQFIALSIHRQATAAFVEADGGAADRLAERQTEVERLVEMVSRHCNRALVSLEEIDQLQTTRPELFDYYETSRHLGRSAHQGVVLARVGSQLSTPLPDDVLADVERVADDARGVVDDAVSAVLDEDGTAAAHDALSRRDDVLADLDALDDRLLSDPTEWGEPTDAVAIARALDALRGSVDHGGTIADVALRGATRADRL